MADIFFFADPAALDAQSADGAFGPVATAKTTQFRVTSLHKMVANGNPAAFAVCEGSVRVQELPDKSLSIVLKPTAELLRGVPISYFVYRGITRRSLIDANEKLKMGAAAITETLLHDTLPSNDPQKMSPDRLGLAFRAANAPTPPSAPEFVREDADPIDTLFFENTDLKPIPVHAGDKLGEFDSLGFGFEIMVRSVWPPPELKLLRAVSVSAGAGNIIDVTGITGPLARAKREMVYSYLDPCAFYGMCFDFKGGVQYKDSGAGGALMTAQDLFDKLLKKFSRRNTVYIDLRNDNGLSYNYYDNYGTGEVLLGLDSNSFASRASKNTPLPTSSAGSYVTDDWPLKIIDFSNLPASAGFDIRSNALKAGIRLAMNTGVAGSGALMRTIFLEFARAYYNANAKTKKDDSVFEPAGKQRLIDVTAVDTSTALPKPWTNDVVLGVPVAMANSKLLPIAFHMRLCYFRQNEPQPAASGRYVSTATSWDNLFILQDNPARWKNDHSSNWWLTGHLKYVKPDLDNQQVFEGVVEAGMAVDRDTANPTEARYTFFYVPVYFFPEPTDYRPTAGANPAGTGGNGIRTSFFQLKEAGKLYDGSRYLTLLKQTEFNSWSSAPVAPVVVNPPPDPIGYLSYLTYLEPVRPDDQKEQGANPGHAKESVYAMSFSSAEYTALLNLAGSFDRKLHPVFLQVRRRVFPRNDPTATRRAYQALELRLAGLDANGVYHSVDVLSTGPGAILPLSLPADGHLFCTNDAAAFEPLLPCEDVQICTQVRHETLQDSARDNDHAADVIYFARAIFDLKRYLPDFYKDLQELQLKGAEVILHDDPGLKKRRRYRIVVAFDDSLRPDREPQVLIASGVRLYTDERIDNEITQPLLNALKTLAIPGVAYIIGESRFEQSAVRVTFAPGTNVSADEMLVKTRLASFPWPSASFHEISSEEGRDPSGGFTTGISYVAKFPRESDLAKSTSDVKMSKLQTLADLSASDRDMIATATATNDPLGYGDVATFPTQRRLNESRYAALNADRHFSSAEVNERFLADYTDAEIDANIFRLDRLYLETVWKALRSGGPGKTDPHRVHLADLATLGIGTYDPEKSVTIRLNRRSLTKEDEKHLAAAGKETGVYPRRRTISNVLAHELGHAESMIRNPTIMFLWDMLESFFDGVVTDPTITIASAVPSGLASRRLKTDVNYPNPVTISNVLAQEDSLRSPEDRNQKLHTLKFLAKTGDGHLRGSPSGRRACSIEHEMDDKVLAEILALLAKFNETLPASYDYCFLNLDGADLNP